jgi:hypothetical protein
MGLSTEKTIIISGTMIGSIFLFSTSLYCVNDILLRRNDNDSKTPKDENYVNKLIIINGLTMLFSGTVFGYFTYYAIK